MLDGATCVFKREAKGQVQKFAQKLAPHSLFPCCGWIQTEKPCCFFPYSDEVLNSLIKSYKLRLLYFFEQVSIAIVFYSLKTQNEVDLV